jgi:uncharacterized membrane protein
MSGGRNDRLLRRVILGLSILGAGIAAYLTYAHLAHVQVACTTGGCETVQTSRYAELAGIPVAALGLAGYLVLAVTAAFRTDAARAIGLAAAAFGLMFAGYLLYVQAALIGAFCQWCLASDLILLLLAVATSLRLRTD